MAQKQGGIGPKIGIKTRPNRQMKKANTVFHWAIWANLLTVFFIE